MEKIFIKIRRKEKGTMQKFEYVITDEIGIHARPAGLLAKCAKQFESDVTISCDGKSASAKALMSVMGLGVGQGAAVTVTVEGADEAEAAAAVEKFMSETL